MIIIAAISCVLLGAILFFSIAVLGSGGSYTDSNGDYKKISWKTSISHTMEHPMFAEYGGDLLPWHFGLASKTIPWMSYYWMCVTSGWNTSDVVDGVNFMIDIERRGGAHCLSFYYDDEKSDSPDKESTYMLYIPGDKDKPFAFVVPGGGFTSYALSAEGFTAARELHGRGYPVFILRYRVDHQTPMAEQEKKANEDFAAALEYIFENASRLGVITEGYSVWGYSAGGRLCNLWQLGNEYGFVAHGLPAPAATILAYSGWYDEQIASAYSTVGATYFSYTRRDKILGKELTENIEKTIRVYREQGAPVDVFVCDKAPHGYGTGKGTDAEGWMLGAFEFWETQLTEIKADNI